MRKEINGISYLVYKAGMQINNPKESYYIENNLDYDGDMNCLHFYALKKVIVRGNQDVGGYQYVRGYQDVRGNQYVRGYQDVRGNQDVGGNQYVGGYQNVRGNQDVGGYQYVRYIYLHIYCKYPFRIDRDSDNIKIGCVEKTVSEWEAFFKNKEQINLSPEDRQYKKLALAFEAAKAMIPLLKGMNDKPKQ